MCAANPTRMKPNNNLNKKNITDIQSNFTPFSQSQFSMEQKQKKIQALELLKEVKKFSRAFYQGNLFAVAFSFLV